MGELAENMNIAGIIYLLCSLFFIISELGLIRGTVRHLEKTLKLKEMKEMMENTSTFEICEKLKKYSDENGFIFNKKLPKTIVTDEGTKRTETFLKKYIDDDKNYKLFIDMFNSKCSNEYISSTKLDVLKEKIKNRKNEKENSCRELIDFVEINNVLTDIPERVIVDDETLEGDYFIQKYLDVNLNNEVEECRKIV
tara:strand:- start:428 stop:1015 length:588 start_codon:yes stop_codon:yes gene_type:complete